MRDCKLHKRRIWFDSATVSKAILPQGLVTRCCLVQLGVPFGEAASLQGHVRAREAIEATVTTEKSPWHIVEVVVAVPTITTTCRDSDHQHHHC